MNKRYKRLPHPYVPKPKPMDKPIHEHYFLINTQPYGIAQWVKVLIDLNYGWKRLARKAIRGKADGIQIADGLVQVILVDGLPPSQGREKGDRKIERWSAEAAAKAAEQGRDITEIEA